MLLSTSRRISVSGSIGENQVTIYGYTSPNSRVQIDTTNVFALTYSQEDGYFEFDRILLPKNPHDLCLHSQDESGRLTPPICIPPPPATNYHTRIGAILLPPTLTLDSTLQNATGQAPPNSPIKINFYQTNSPIQIIKPAAAFSLPTLLTESDSTGNFSLNLPDISASRYRLYATVSYQGSPSPKSNTLTYALPGQFNYLIILLPLFFLTLIFSSYLLFFSRRRRYLPALYPKSLALFINHNS